MRRRAATCTGSRARCGRYRSGSYLNFEEEAADAASFYGEETYRRLRAVKADVDPDELFLANHAIPPGGSNVKTGIHGGGETHLAPTTPRAPPVARSLVSPVLHHQRDITERGVTCMTTTLDTHIAAVRRTEGSRTIFGRLLAPIGGLGLVAGLIALMVSPASDDTGETPAEVVAYAASHEELERRDPALRPRVGRPRRPLHRGPLHETPPRRHRDASRCSS